MSHQRQACSYSIARSQAAHGDVQGMTRKQSLPAPDDGFEAGAVREMFLFMPKVRAQSGLLSLSPSREQQASDNKLDPHDSRLPSTAFGSLRMQDICHFSNVLSCAPFGRDGLGISTGPPVGGEGLFEFQKMRDLIH